MPDNFPRDRPHIHLAGGGLPERYTRRKQKFEAPPLPVRDRQAHAARLELSIGAAVAAARQQIAGGDTELAAGRPGFYLEIEIPAGARAVVDQLADRRKDMEVVAVREPERPDAPIIASVYIPEKAATYYLDKVDAYKNTETAKGAPRNEPLVTRIDTVRLGTARSLFTDESALFPQMANERVWWEVWLRDGRRESFERMANALAIALKGQAVHFPEREVLLAFADAATLDRLVAHSDVIAELRRAKDFPAAFLCLDGAGQRPWTEAVLRRLHTPDGANVAVCLLDSGVHRGHPLILPALSVDDHHTINPAWGPEDTADYDGHGTRMAGVILYGDLVHVLGATAPVNLSHYLESVRILPPTAGPANDPTLYGAITGEAIARVEIQAPRRRRAVVMPVSSASPARGRPSSWSATIDQLCFEEDNPRLIILSAGNIRTDLMPADHLVRNDVEPLDDPAQSWNALTVGAFTEKVDILDPTFRGYQAIAPQGELSPRSRTSVSWDRQWPIKPDVVFEGGNLAHNGRLPGEAIDDLQLLTTNFRPIRQHFTTLSDTSAAAALAGNMAGAVMAARPRLWPETVRALVVHSAEWTPPMKAWIDGCGGAKNKIHALLRRYGYGVPDLARALRSARNDLTLMVEDTLQPFEREGKGAPTTRDMKLHRLPWPREQLRQFGQAHVELRVTLSYFIEPNPGDRGWTRRYRYASHGLRFSVKSATESVDEFRVRINQAARDEEDGVAHVPAGADEWLLGTSRHCGSIHSDFWQGTAADLAERDAVGVFPVGGWWKEKPFLERFNKTVRYALIVTIRAPGTDIDIYTPVEVQVAIANQVEA